MRLGYSFWGHLSDYKIKNGKEISAPDGNASYSWAIIHEALNRGWTVYAMQEDRDIEAVKLYGKQAFASFSTDKRMIAWLDTRPTVGPIGYCRYPKLDVLLLEWRWPIEGRNFNILKDDKNYQPDFDRQMELLRYYRDTGTKIIFWDLDHKLTYADELTWQPAAIFETSSKPLRLYKERISVEPPFVTADLLQHEMKVPRRDKKLVYVGSRYERDDIIDKYVKEVSEKYPGSVKFYGNWSKTIHDCLERWPHIDFRDRITMKDFYEVYSDAVCCPLLAKKDYLASGFITPRVHEAILFGTIPVGLIEHEGIEDYTPYYAEDAEDLADICQGLSDMDYHERNVVREEIAHKLEFTDVKYFADHIEDVLSNS